MRDNCGRNQQPAQQLNLPTALVTEGPTDLKVSDSWCWVLPPSQTGAMTASASLELSTAIIHAAKLVLVLKPGMHMPPALTQKLNLCLQSSTDPNTGPALATMYTPLPCAFTYSPTAEPVYTPGTSNHHYLPYLPIAEARDTAENHYSYVSIH